MYPDVITDSAGRTVLSSDSGEIDSEYVWEETVQVSDDNED